MIAWHWWVSLSPSDPSVGHWDRLFDSSPIKGEGDMVGLYPPRGFLPMQFPCDVNAIRSRIRLHQ